jgi:hypothetical protein
MGTSTVAKTYCHNFAAASPGFIKQVHNPNGFKHVTHSRDGDFGTFFSSLLIFLLCTTFCTILLYF